MHAAKRNCWTGHWQTISTACCSFISSPLYPASPLHLLLLLCCHRAASRVEAPCVCVCRWVYLASCPALNEFRNEVIVNPGRYPLCVCVCVLLKASAVCVFVFFNTRSYLVNNSSCSRHRSCALFLTLLLLPIGNGHANCLFILAYIHKLQRKSRICYRNYIVKCFIWSALSLVCGQPEHNTVNPWYKQKQNASSFCMLHFPLIKATKFYFHYGKTEYLTV